jgi:hypothetical protein
MLVKDCEQGALAIEAEWDIAGLLMLAGEGVMELTLTAEERELVTAILAERHRELLREISRTSHHDFKLVLRKNEQLLESILNKLGAAQPVHW